MKTAYSFQFSEDTEVYHYSPGELPKWLKNPMRFATIIAHYKSKNSELIIQRAGLCPFNIDLIEIRANEAWDIPFSLEEKHLFLFFLFDGSLLFRSVNNHPIAQVECGKFFMSYYGKGHYIATTIKGSCLALVVNLDPGWVQRLSHDYHLLQNVLKEYHNSMPYYAKIMQQFTIDRKVKSWLNEISAASPKNAVITEASQLLYLSNILGHYDYLIKNSYPDPVYLVLYYIDEHFKDSEISTELLTDKFFITERTLHKRFSKEFKTTPYQYITLLRMQLLSSLLK